MKEITKEDWISYFPFSEPRKEQETAINFILNAFGSGKKYVIADLATGIGKSAIGVTVSKYLNIHFPIEAGFTPGSYFLTTQKVLQDQYLKDFGGANGPMTSIKSSSNFMCTYYAHQNCGESKRIISNLRKQIASTDFFRNCTTMCPHTIAKQKFVNSPQSLTNYAYFLADANFAQKIEPRTLLVLDEAHNTEASLSSFVEIAFSERFASSTLKLDFPSSKDAVKIVEWIKKKYAPAVKKHTANLLATIEKNYVGGDSVLSSNELSKQYEIIDMHYSKVLKFLSCWKDDNWVMNIEAAEGMKKRKISFKPIDVDMYTEEHLFRFGQKVLFMSATIVNEKIFRERLGIKEADAAFISMESPFKLENRMIDYLPVGKMSRDSIDKTLPIMMEVIKMLLEKHKSDKGIIHCGSYKIANTIRDSISDSRLLIQDDINKEYILGVHSTSKEPTVLVSPSMTEGVDLKDDLGRFQIFCKVPYPFLGDEVIVKRRDRNPAWYQFATLTTIVQAVGRSIRNENDYAASYMLDECFSMFMKMNSSIIPAWFKKTVRNSK